MIIFYEILAPNGKISHLFGTMHLNTSDICNLSLEVKRALDACSLCLIEADLGLPSKLAARYSYFAKRSHWIAANLTKDLSYPDGYLSDLQAYLIELELKPPFAADATLPIEVAFYISSKCEPYSEPEMEYTLDEQIYHYTRHKVSFLEDLSDHLPIIFGLDLNFNEQLDYYHAIHDLIASGQIVTQHSCKISYLNVDLPIPTFSSEDSLPVIKKYYDKFKTARDTKMAESIHMHLADETIDGNIFTAVGAMHLPGIVRNLQEKGYIVNPVSLGKRIYPVSCPVEGIPWVACEKEELTFICEILIENPDIIHKTYRDATLFHTACKAGHLNIAYLLLAFKPNIIDLLYRDKYTALHIASKTGKLEMVHALIRMGANINYKATITGNTPLHLACIKGHENVVAALLEHGAQFLENSKKQTPLNCAEASGHTNIALILSEHFSTLTSAENKNTSSLPFSSLLSQVGSPIYTQDDQRKDEGDKTPHRVQHMSS